MINGASAYDDDFITSVVSSVVVLDQASIDVLKVIVVTANRLAHHMISEGVEVASLKSGGLEILIQGIVFRSLLALYELKLSGINEGVLNAVTKH